MREALEEHDEIVRNGVEAHGGRLIKHTGDGVIAGFGSAPDAIRTAANVQRRISQSSYPDIGPLRLRMAIHTGEVEERDGDYFGPPLNRAARLLSVANGGQVLASLVTERLASGSLDPGLGLRDLGEHRLRDLARPERVFQVDIEGLPGDFPPLRTPDIVPNNLPTLPTSFVGRDQELAELMKLVRGSRLVTITGVGGAGKTRLALQAAAEVGAEFPDGIWLIELGAVTDPELIDATVAGAIGVAQKSGSIREAIVDHLAERQALLIVDNCEHLIGGAAELVDEIIASAVGCRIIATSRELLGIGGEVAYGLRSMHLPGRNGPSSLSELARYDAVRLFLERAEAARPDFRISAQTATAVAEICRRLDGMPLALELAAARLRTFTPRQIAANLDQRFRLLTGGSRTALPRQQTLAAAIDWSYRLLEDPERLLFERLSVFQGGFTLEAVTAVCTDDHLDTFQVLELLPSLVDKSLVVVDAEGEEARYRLLETLRQFARDRFDDSGVADQIRVKHAVFFKDLAVEAGNHIRGPDEIQWWERIDTELDNLRQAMTWAMDAGEAELALEIAGGFWRFWWFTSRWSEGVAWLQRTVEAAGPEAAKRLRAQGLLGYGSLLEPTERHAEAEQLLREAIKLYEELDAEGADPDDLMFGYSAAYINLSVELETLGRDPEEGARLNRRALEIARRINERAGEAVALGNLAEHVAKEGDVEEARLLFAEALEASKSLHSTQRLVDQYMQLGFFELAMGTPVKALEAFEKSLVHAEEAGLEELSAIIRAYVAACESYLGDPLAVKRFASHVSDAFENPEMRTFGTVKQTLLSMRAGMDLDAGDLERAARVLGVSLALEEAGTVPIWNMKIKRDAALEAVRARLGETASREAMQAGRELPDDAVVQLILG
jgi:predicted ATPase